MTRRFPDMAVCLCPVCSALDRAEGIDPTDFPARRQLRLPLPAVPLLPRPHARNPGPGNSARARTMEAV